MSPAVDPVQQDEATAPSADVRDEVLAAVLSRAPVMVFALDQDATCIYSDGAGLDLIGLRPGQVVGLDMREMYADDPASTEFIRRALAGESFRSEYTVAGTPVTFETWWLPTVGPDGAVTGALGISTDVSEVVAARRQLEQAVARQRGLLVSTHEAQDAERRRIAGDVHDDTIQVLAAVNIRLQTLRRHLAEGSTEPGEVSDLLGRLDEAVRGATERLRALIVELVPAPLGEDGLHALLTRQADAVFRGRHPSRTIRVIGDRPPAEHVARALLRIAQEALTNVRKHAGAQRVHVEVTESAGAFDLVVSDDGSGVPPGDVGHGHLGLRSMVERAETLGGWCTVGERAGGGTVIRAHIPERLALPREGAGTQQQRLFFEQTMELISDGYCALDGAGRILHLNGPAYRLMGLDHRTSLVGQVLWDVLPSSPGLRATCRAAQVAQTVRTVAGHEPPWVTRVQCRIVPSGAGLSLVVRDLSHQPASQHSDEEP